MYRSKKLLKVANGAPCMNCGKHSETVVACHANWHEYGKGTSLKSHDCFVAYLCQRCHNVVDGRDGSTIGSSDRKWIWQMAHAHTLLYWFEQGIVK